MQRSRSKEPGPIVSCQTPTCTGNNEVMSIFCNATTNLTKERSPNCLCYSLFLIIISWLLFHITTKVVIPTTNTKNTKRLYKTLNQFKKLQEKKDKWTENRRIIEHQHSYNSILITYYGCISYHATSAHHYTTTKCHNTFFKKKK